MFKWVVFSIVIAFGEYSCLIGSLLSYIWSVQWFVGFVANANQKSFGLGASKQTAQSFCLVGTVTYHMNPENRIYKIDNVYTMKKE